MSQHLWYVSYGSNMSLVRLRCYLEGGCPPGARVTYAGARDSTLPAADVAVELPGSLYFAGESRTWGGGVAFYDHDVPGPTPARAYKITAEQFADVAAQELHRIDRKSVVEGTRVSVRVNLGGRRLIKQKTYDK